MTGVMFATLMTNHDPETLAEVSDGNQVLGGLSDADAHLGGAA